VNKQCPNSKRVKKQSLPRLIVFLLF